eukprot:scaffold23529_cov51-Phaeocystis_antarctica.AAC.2
MSIYGQSPLHPTGRGIQRTLRRRYCPAHRDLVQQRTHHVDWRCVGRPRAIAEGQVLRVGVSAGRCHALQGGHVPVRLLEPLCITIRAAGDLHEEDDLPPIDRVCKRQRAPPAIGGLVGRQVEHRYAAGGEGILESA